MRSLATLGLLGMVCLMARGVLAQGASATFTGVVTRDTIGTPVAGAEIRLLDIGRSARSDAKGEFRFAGVPAGSLNVTVRAVGFEPFVATVTIAAGQTLDADLTLTPASVLLDTVRSVGSRHPALPWKMQEFESRRQTAASGQFLTDSLLHAHQDEMMASLVGMLNGAKLAYSPKSTAVYLASSRNGGSGKPAFLDTGGGPCLVTVYVDGIQVYPGGEAPDFGHMKAGEYAGVEFYASPSQVPAQYSRTGTSCGVVLLWRKP
jgi:hypothetical protein